MLFLLQCAIITLAFLPKKTINISLFQVANNYQMVFTIDLLAVFYATIKFNVITWHRLE